MKLLAVTACPSGVAHTYMAAEALKEAAKKANVEIKVETQGSIGIENEITSDEVIDASAVILTNDIGIKKESRFKSLPIVRVSVSNVVKKSDQIIKQIVQKLDN
jgi:fructose-specific PTS system IIB-like component